MFEVLLAAALAAASPAIEPAAPPRDDPAMFVVQDQDTTVFIFGTFHALDGEGSWFNPRVRSAFEQSSELVLETLVPEGPAPALRQPPATVTPSASFLATTRMAIKAGRAQGMQVAYGADMVLRQAAQAEGKPVEGLETLESQLAMFTRMPPAPTAAQPASPQARTAGSPDSSAMDSLSKTMITMQQAWKRGDQSVFVNMLAQLERSSPSTYRMLFPERNARWADWIAARLDSPGTVFVAVGAGHLAGKDSVLVHLAQLGIESRRVNPPVYAQP